MNRLDVIDEKIDWFLSKGQQGAHPLSDRISQIEQHLEQQNVTLNEITNILHPLSDRMSQIEPHLEQQNAKHAWIKDVLSVSKGFSIDMYKLFLFPQAFVVPEIPDIGHPD